MTRSNSSMSRSALTIVGATAVGLIVAVTVTRAEQQASGTASEPSAAGAKTAPTTATPGASGSAAAAAATKTTPVAVPLATPESFASISDTAERSAALFSEAAKVLTHPRCVNCHPAGDNPLQGDDGRLHEPPVIRGSNGHGVVGMRCQTCHQEANFDPGRIPGVKDWHLAPKSMAWEGKTATEICEQIKDPERNGTRSLAQIDEHMSKDHLVAWAWAPGIGRKPPPGDHKTFGALIHAWVETGAVCPKP